MPRISETKITGVHRSYALAERHLRKLGDGWQITSRRRADGHYSQRGHYFTFEFTPPEEPPPPPEGDVFEWIVGHEYEDSGRSFDVIVTAHDETEAYEVSKNFLASDPEGSRIVNAGYFGWIVTPVRGEATSNEAGEAEYRSTSKRTGKARQ